METRPQHGWTDIGQERSPGQTHVGTSSDSDARRAHCSKNRKGLSLGFVDKRLLLHFPPSPISQDSDANHEENVVRFLFRVECLHSFQDESTYDFSD
jgi:hypothetical protein